MRFNKLSLSRGAIPHPENTIPSRGASSRIIDAERPIADGGSSEFLRWCCPSGLDIARCGAPEI